MNEFIVNINSLYWWVSVVVVGLLLNIFSSYFKDGIDETFSFFSKKWTNRTLEKRQQKERQIEYLIGDKFKQLEFLMFEMRDRLRLIYHCFLVALQVFLVAEIDTVSKNSEVYSLSSVIKLLFFCSFILTISNAMSHLFSAVQKMEISYEVKTRERNLVETKNK